MERRPTTRHFSDRTRRVLRWAVGLALPFLGLLTVALFTATSGVVPEGFTSWRDLGCRVRLTQPGPTFIGITQCGRAYVTAGDQPDSNGLRHVEFHDLLTSESLGTVVSASLEFALSKSKKNLLQVDSSGAVLTELATGKKLAGLNIDGYIQFCINVKTNTVLLRSDNRAETWDMETGQRLRAFMRQREPVTFAFSNSAGEPKCITFVPPTGQLELWDESKGHRDIVLKEGTVKVVTPGFTFSLDKPFTLSPDGDWVALPSGKAISMLPVSGDSLIRMLPEDHDARFVTSVTSGSALIRCGSKLKFSLNNLWLTQEYNAAHPLVTKAGDVNANVGQWLAKWLPDENFVDLLNLETGETWRRMPASRDGVAFSEDDSRLITFGTKGRYIWSVPPRMQWFTPWALVALATWLGLALCWWKLRRRFAVEPSTPPTA